MKAILIFVSIVLFSLSDTPKDQSYTGSTPAAFVVRSFLGISQTESIDFIRWDLTLLSESYQLTCDYGVAKPNTNGFMNGGKHVELSGLLRREKNQYRLINSGKTLALAKVNNNLLYLMDSENHLIVGTEGWSYALNNLDPMPSDQTAWIGRPLAIKDSISFVGRTPCRVAGFDGRKECYKLKWAIVLYKSGQNAMGKYKLWGSPWYKEGGRRGAWKIIEEKDHRIFYLLNDDKGNEFARLLALDENVLAFTDAKGNLLVGNLDFSYTLNRRW